MVQHLLPRIAVVYFNEPISTAGPGVTVKPI